MPPQTQPPPATRHSTRTRFVSARAKGMSPIRTITQAFLGKKKGKKSLSTIEPLVSTDTPLPSAQSQPVSSPSVSQPPSDHPSTNTSPPLSASATNPNTLPDANSNGVSTHTPSPIFPHPNSDVNSSSNLCPPLSVIPGTPTSHAIPNCLEEDAGLSDKENKDPTLRRSLRSGRPSHILGECDPWESPDSEEDFAATEDLKRKRRAAQLHPSPTTSESDVDLDEVYVRQTQDPPRRMSRSVRSSKPSPPHTDLEAPEVEVDDEESPESDVQGFDADEGEDAEDQGEGEDEEEDVEDQDEGEEEVEGDDEDEEQEDEEQEEEEEEEEEDEEDDDNDNEGAEPNSDDYEGVSRNRRPNDDDGDRNPRQNYKAGPLSDAAKAAVTALHKAFTMQLTELAQDERKPVQLLYQYLGLDLVTPRRPNKWNVFQAHFRAHNPDVRKGLSRKEYNKLVRVEYQNFIDDATNTGLTKDEALEPILKWFNGHLEQFIVRQNKDGKMETVISKMLNPIISIARKVYETTGVHVFGYAINTKRDARGGSSSVAWGATDDYLAIRQDNEGNVMQAVQDYESMFNLLNMNQVPSSTINPLCVVQWDLIGGESWRDRDARVLKQIACKDIVIILMSDPEKNAKVLKSISKRFPWTTWLDFALEHAVYIEGWDERIKGVPGPGFNIGKLPTQVCREMVERRKEWEDGKSSSDGVFRILPWTSDMVQRNKLLITAAQIPLVKDTKGNDLRIVEHAGSYLRRVAETMGNYDDNEYDDNADNNDNNDHDHDNNADDNNDNSDNEVEMASSPVDVSGSFEGPRDGPRADDEITGHDLFGDQLWGDNTHGVEGDHSVPPPLSSPFEFSPSGVNEEPVGYHLPDRSSSPPYAVNDDNVAFQPSASSTQFAHHTSVSHHPAHRIDASHAISRLSHHLSQPQLTVNSKTAHARPAPQRHPPPPGHFTPSVPSVRAPPPTRSVPSAPSIRAPPPARSTAIPHARPQPRPVNRNFRAHVSSSGPAEREERVQRPFIPSAAYAASTDSQRHPPSRPSQAQSFATLMSTTAHQESTPAARRQQLEQQLHIFNSKDSSAKQVAATIRAEINRIDSTSFAGQVTARPVARTSQPAQPLSAHWGPLSTQGQKRKLDIGPGINSRSGHAGPSQPRAPVRRRIGG